LPRMLSACTPQSEARKPRGRRQRSYQASRTRHHTSTHPLAGESLLRPVPTPSPSLALPSRVETVFNNQLRATWIIELATHKFPRPVETRFVHTRCSMPLWLVGSTPARAASEVVVNCSRAAAVALDTAAACGGNVKCCALRRSNSCSTACGTTIVAPRRINASYVSWKPCAVNASYAKTKTANCIPAACRCLRRDSSAGRYCESSPRPLSDKCCRSTAAGRAVSDRLRLPTVPTSVVSDEHAAFTAASKSFSSSMEEHFLHLATAVVAWRQDNHVRR
jgi:hypothetical protein